MANREPDPNNRGIDHTRQIVRQPGRLYGEIDALPGTNLPTMTRLAAKIAAIEGIEIRFEFNQRTERVTVDEAKTRLTPAEIKKQIDYYEAGIRRRLEEIEEIKRKIEEEKKLGTLLHGPGFSDTLKT